MQNLIFLVQMNVEGKWAIYLRPSVFYLCVRCTLIVSYWCTSRTFILLWKNEHRWTFFQRCFRSMKLSIIFIEDRNLTQQIGELSFLTRFYYNSLLLKLDYGTEWDCQQSINISINQSVKKQAISQPQCQESCMCSANGEQDPTLSDPL